MSTISGLFDLYQNAQWALEVLDIYGVDGKQISVISLGSTKSRPSGWGLTALLSMGFSQEEAEFYSEGIKRGDILISVTVGSEEEHRVRAILRGAGSVEMKTEIRTYSQGSQSESTQSQPNASM